MFLLKKKVDDYVNEGIYGTKQTKPEERRKYLGTIRERIVLVLTKGQVMKKRGLKEMDALMKEHNDAKLLLNGNIRVSAFSPYRKIASKNHIPYTVVANKNTKTDFAAILTYDTKAIDREDIFLAEEDMVEKKEEEKNGLGAFFKKLFTGPK
nr:YueI family protein [Salirhabdus sp. Marseille-P4669]